MVDDIDKKTDQVFAQLAELPEAQALSAKEEELGSLRSEVEQLSSELRTVTEELGKHVPRKADPFGEPDEPAGSDADKEAVAQLQERADALRMAIGKAQDRATKAEAELPELCEQRDAAKTERVTAYARQLYGDYCQSLLKVQACLAEQLELANRGVELSRSARLQRQEYDLLIRRIFAEVGPIGDPRPMEGRQRKEAGIVIAQASRHGVGVFVHPEGPRYQNGTPAAWNPSLPTNPSGLVDQSITNEWIEQALAAKQQVEDGDPRPEIKPKAPGVITTDDIEPALKWKERQRQRAVARRESERDGRAAITTGSRSVQERAAARRAERDKARIEAHKKPVRVITTNGEPRKQQKSSRVITTSDIAERKAKRSRQHEKSGDSE